MSKEEQWLLKEKYNGTESEAFRADCKRLAAGEPLAYVIGYIPFLGCIIYLENHPLIPRPETEWWAEKAINEIKKTMNVHMNVHGPMHILDLCAGSGAIGVAVAKHIPEAFVDFVEIEPKLMPPIERNIVTNCTTKEKLTDLDSSRLNLELGDMYRVIEADLFSSRFNLELGQYDFILSNPPYIDPAIDRAEDSVKKYEPHQALYGGSNGMEFIERIITEAPQYLKKDGQLWLEHEPEQTDNIHTLAKEHGFSVTTHLDQFALERYSVLVLQ